VTRKISYSKMSESDYRKSVEETQKETSTSDAPESGPAPESGGERQDDDEDESEPRLRDSSQEAATGRPGQDHHFQETVEEIARRDAGIDEPSEVTPGSSPVARSGGGEPASSGSDEVPAGT
jgi:hypothetical protein